MDVPRSMIAGTMVGIVAAEVEVEVVVEVAVVEFEGSGKRSLVADFGRLVALCTLAVVDRLETDSTDLSGKVDFLAMDSVGWKRIGFEVFLAILLARVQD